MGEEGGGLGEVGAQVPRNCRGKGVYQQRWKVLTRNCLKPQVLIFQQDLGCDPLLGEERLLNQQKAWMGSKMEEIPCRV